MNRTEPKTQDGLPLRPLRRDHRRICAAGNGLRHLPFLRVTVPAAILMLCGSAAFAQYSVDWSKIGGGGTGTGGVYTVSGTVGQPDASGAMTGGSFSLTGGFWSLISVVQTARLPSLAITHAGSSVIVSWPNAGSYTLQQNGNAAAPGGWITSGYSISTSAGTNSITITPPTGNLFFRLSDP